jgi:hypothetical protein
MSELAIYQQLKMGGLAELPDNQPGPPDRQSGASVVKGVFRVHK